MAKLIVTIVLCQLVIISNALSMENNMEDFDKKLPIKGEVFKVNGHVAFLILPEKQSSEMAWVWYAPTLPGLPGPEETWMFEKFLEKGIAIAGIDVGESFGSPKGRELFSAFYKELTENHKMGKKACLLARSRGGLMLYNWAVENPTLVACIAGIYPVCNLKSYPGLEIASKAYNMTLDKLQEKLAEHNPIDRLQSLAKEKVPIFHIHGDSDTAVPLEDNSGELAKRYRQFGGEAIILVPEGQGHNMWTGFFQCQELVDFVIKYANPNINKAQNK